MKYYQGKFVPKNPGKYRGDPNKIMARSSWEVKLMVYLDENPSVLEWSSEEIGIGYFSPLDNKDRTYYPDFWVKKINASDGKTKELLIEVKPKNQTIQPKKPMHKKQMKRYMEEVYTWTVNNAKWEAAKKFAASQGWDFVIMDETALGIKKF